MTLRKKSKERNDADAGLNWQQIQNEINREEGEDTFDHELTIEADGDEKKTS